MVLSTTADDAACHHRQNPHPHPVKLAGFLCQPKGSELGVGARPSMTSMISCRMPTGLKLRVRLEPRWSWGIGSGLGIRVTVRVRANYLYCIVDSSSLGLEFVYI